MRSTGLLVLGALLLCGSAVPSHAQGVLRIGLNEDPDVLDPHRSRSFVGRIVFGSLCDKLVDITPTLEFTPALATTWSWNADSTQLTLELRRDAKFHDGTRVDAAAVKANLDRARTLPDSLRKSEISSVSSVDVVDEFTVRLTLSEPNATILAQLSDRAGMMLSPAAFGENDTLSREPVCSGPYRFESRTQNDRIVLAKFPDHYDAARYRFDQVVFLPIPDTTVRLANLQSGDLDLIERMAPSDAPAVEASGTLKLAVGAGLGYQSLTVNVANGERAKTPLGEDKRIRQALNLALDRDVINEVVGGGIWAPAGQPFPPSSPYHSPRFPAPARDVERAKALLAEAGQERVAFEMLVASSSTGQQVGELIQAMAAEAGFDVTLRPIEFAAMQQEMPAGNFQVSQVGWSGRVDPDGNIHQYVSCEGGLNDMRYCNKEVDRLLNEARRATDPAARLALYDQAQAILQDELPIVYTYYQSYPFAHSARLTGFVPYPDGIIRLRDVALAN
jgi:peptide/nickel transport system substrate-binding protein